VFLWRQRPEFVIFQWWTGTVAHSYVALALLARLRGAKLVIEFHEVIETGEDRISFARRYIRMIGPVLIGLAHAFAVHSDFDRRLVREAWHLGHRPVVIVPHGRCHARSSARAARYLVLPPCRATSRLIVDAARPERAAISRSETPSASPREISSRSVGDSDRGDRRRGVGTYPPLDATTPWIDPGCLPKARPMSLSDSPAFQRAHSSRF